MYQELGGELTPRIQPLGALLVQRLSFYRVATAGSGQVGRSLQQERATDYDRELSLGRHSAKCHVVPVELLQEPAVGWQER